MEWYGPMNEEQSKRLADAADAVIQSSEAVAEAADALSDPRFSGEQERDRTQAAQQAANKLENGGKKVQDALRKAAVAAASSATAGVYERYQAGAAAAAASRDGAKAIANEDGSANKQAKAQQSMESLDAALASAVSLVFPSE